MIYDVFLFNNEFDILDIHLNVHNELVDRFVLVESIYTHSGKPKPAYFSQNKDDERFQPFLDKIIHLIVLDKPFKDSWENETLARNYASRALMNIKSDDIIICGDVDEIINPAVFDTIRNTQKHSRLEMKVFYYYLNCRSEKVEFRGSSFLRGRDFTTVQEIRRPKHEEEKWSPWGLPPIKNAGWHLSYMGGTNAIMEKLASFSHTEYDNSIYRNSKKIEEKIRKFDDILDRNISYYPIKPEEIEIEYIRKNIDKFSHLIL